jgi:hypothetical protein
MGYYHTRQFIFHTRILVGWFFWELKTLVFWSSWLKDSATWGISLQLKAFVLGSWALPLFSHHALAFA